MDFGTALRIARSYDYNYNNQIDAQELYVDPVARQRLNNGWGQVSVDDLAWGLARDEVYIGYDRSVRPTYSYPYPPAYPPAYPPPPYYPGRPYPGRPYPSRPYPPPHHHPHRPYPSPGHRASIDPAVGNTIAGGVIGGVIGGLAGGERGAIGGALIGGAVGFLGSRQ